MANDNTQHNNSMNTEFLVDQLIREYSRVSDGFHKAIDNYYRILPLILSVLVLIFGLISKTGIDIVYCLVPFLLLILLFVESQIRTTIICASKYLALLETRVNKLVDFQLLLYESKLTLGKILYYSFNKYSLLKFMSFLPFAVIGIALYFFSLIRFRNFIYKKGFIEIFSLRLCSEYAFYIYLVFLLLITVLSLASWLVLYQFSIKKYGQIIEKTYSEFTSDE